jgi:hypothetical protein
MECRGEHVMFAEPDRRDLKEVRLTCDGRQFAKLCVTGARPSDDFLRWWLEGVIDKHDGRDEGSAE